MVEANRNGSQTVCSGRGQLSAKNDVFFNGILGIMKGQDGSRWLHPSVRFHRDFSKPSCLGVHTWSPKLSQQQYVQQQNSWFFGGKFFQDLPTVPWVAKQLVSLSKIVIVGCGHLTQRLVRSQIPPWRAHALLRRYWLQNTPDLEQLVDMKDLSHLGRVF